MSGYGVKDIAEFTARLADLRTTYAPPSEVGTFVAYTDGSCLGNPRGPGGWAAVVFTADQTTEWRLFGHLSSTSNNRAEALGVLAALEWAPPGSQLVLRSDSELTVRILQGRYKVKANSDVWELIFRTRQEKRLALTYEWVRAHVGDPLNELADQLSKLGAHNGLLEDLVVPTTSAPLVPVELAGLEPRGDWEREFVSSVAQQLSRGRSLSPKQQAVIDRMRARDARG